MRAPWAQADACIFRIGKVANSKVENGAKPQQPPGTHYAWAALWVVAVGADEHGPSNGGTHLTPTRWSMTRILCRSSTGSQREEADCGRRHRRANWPMTSKRARRATAGWVRSNGWR